MNRNSHVESYTNWLSFSRCKREVSESMENTVMFYRRDHSKAMTAICQGMEQLVNYCGKGILKTCFNFDKIQQINSGLLTNMKGSIDNLRVSNYCDV